LILPTFNAKIATYLAPLLCKLASSVSLKLLFSSKPIESSSRSKTKPAKKEKTNALIFALWILREERKMLDKQ